MLLIRRYGIGLVKGGLQKSTQVLMDIDFKNGFQKTQGRPSKFGAQKYIALFPWSARQSQ